MKGRGWTHQLTAEKMCSRRQRHTTTFLGETTNLSLRTFHRKPHTTGKAMSIHSSSLQNLCKFRSNHLSHLHGVRHCKLERESFKGGSRGRHDVLASLCPFPIGSSISWPAAPCSTTGLSCECRITHLCFGFNVLALQPYIANLRVCIYTGITLRRGFRRISTKPQNSTRPRRQIPISIPRLFRTKHHQPPN